MRQVGVKKANVSEPPMTCRNQWDDIKTEVARLLREKSGRNLPTAQMVSGIQAARA